MHFARTQIGQFLLNQCKNTSYLQFLVFSDLQIRRRHPKFLKKVEVRQFFEAKFILDLFGRLVGIEQQSFGF